mmetsp:Transcript_13093/g.28284  ORF Transcript_13093/g.28284 Transcript_13093/m.28284 type:complete len:101 (+) Transcript_13093:379-681(+)
MNVSMVACGHPSLVNAFVFRHIALMQLMVGARKRVALQITTKHSLTIKGLHGLSMALHVWLAKHFHRQLMRSTQVKKFAVQTSTLITLMVASLDERQFRN